MGFALFLSLYGMAVLSFGIWAGFFWRSAFVFMFCWFQYRVSHSLTLFMQRHGSAYPAGILAIQSKSKGQS
jgi:hypothetical protein